jgi:Domain of unknown function (DUF5916)/Carbohydrate family 9 binding domain-like
MVISRMRLTGRWLAPFGVAAFILGVSASASAQAHDHPAAPDAAAADAALPSAPGSRDQYQIQARRVGQRPPELDGLLNDEAWRDAPVIDSFTQQEPVNGQPATERTEVRVLYDANHLYIGVRAFDSEPDSVISTEMRRDSARMLDEDNFQIILDTFRDRRTGYMFVTNPLGAKLEQQIFEEGGGNTRGASSNVNRDWNGVWDAAARRTSDGWTAEIEIPMVTLRSPDVEVQTWGLNFMRNIRHKNEQVYWSPIPKPYGLMQVSMAGTVTGMTDLNRGLDLRIKPYAIGGGRRDSLGNAVVSDGIHDMGLDLKYGLKAGLGLDVTVNTDFAQAEVDEQQVNLTRFPLFFPEKRDFFLENSGQFTVSSQGTDRMLDLFFSRRIGLSALGQPIGINGGARVTGKMSGGHNVAVMDLQTEQTTGRPGENFFIGRYSKDLSRRSKVGGLIINKEGIDSRNFNRTIAGDAVFAPNSSFSWHSFIAKTATPGVTDDQMAFHTRALFVNTKWQTYAEFTDIDNNFNDELGFVPRRGIRTSKVHLERNPRPGGLIRVMEPMINLTYTTDQQNRLLTRRVHQMLGTRFQNGTYLNVWWNNWLDRLDTPFAIQSDVVIPVGVYRFDEYMFMYSSNPARRFYQRVQYSPQTFYDGTRTDYDLTLGLRAASRAAVEYSLQRNDVDLPWGDFVVNLSILRLDFALSPRQTIRSLSQYNSYTKQLSTSIRYNFIYRPGSDIYVVYDELQTDTYGRPQLRNRQFVIKTTYLLSR